MSTIACALLWALLIPLGVILWVTETRQQRITRLHRCGWSQHRIAQHLHCSRYQVRKVLA